MRQSNKHEIKRESIRQIATEVEKVNIIRGRTVIRSRGRGRATEAAEAEVERQKQQRQSSYKIPSQALFIYIYT